MDQRHARVLLPLLHDGVVVEPNRTCINTAPTQAYSFLDRKFRDILDRICTVLFGSPDKFKQEFESAGGAANTEAFDAIEEKLSRRGADPDVAVAPASSFDERSLCPFKSPEAVWVFYQGESRQPHMWN